MAVSPPISGVPKGESVHVVRRGRGPILGSTPRLIPNPSIGPLRLVLHIIYYIHYDFKHTNQIIKENKLVKVGKRVCHVDVYTNV